VCRQPRAVAKGGVGWGHVSEQEIQQRILLACSKGPSRLWRNNVALAWTGQAQQIKQRGQVVVSPGDVVIRNARPLHAGLCRGSADLIGLSSVTVTPDMIGQRLAVFAAVEVKSATGRATPEQLAFIDVVQQMGGFAGVARSVDDARGILLF
jgi:hypothetical protein